MGKIFWVVALLFITSCSKTTGERPENKVIAIQPYGFFPKTKTGSIATFIAAFYKMKVVVLPAKSLYAPAFINVKSPRYRADSLIQFQKKDMPAAADFIIGLTDMDISATKRNADGKIKSPVYKYTDWGVMGLGYCPGKSCVVSTYRLQSADAALHLLRLKKVVIHEIGHNLWLPHCADKSCVMTDAVESIATIDHAQLDLCKKCRKRLG